MMTGGLKSEDVEGFSNLQRYIPFFYPKLLHPLHDLLVQPVNRLNLLKQKMSEMTFCQCHLLDVII